MIIEPIVKSSQPAWQKQIDLRLKSAGAPASTTPFNRPDEDIDPSPPPAALAAPWPRVFPGL